MTPAALDPADVPPVDVERDAIVALYLAKANGDWRAAINFLAHDLRAQLLAQHDLLRKPSGFRRISPAARPP